MRWWGKNGKAGFEIGKHAALAWRKKAVGFIEDDKTDSSQATNGVLSRRFDVLSEAAGRGDDHVRPGGQIDGLLSLICSSCDEDWLH